MTVSPIRRKTFHSKPRMSTAWLRSTKGSGEHHCQQDTLSGSMNVWATLFVMWRYFNGRGKNFGLQVALKKSQDITKLIRSHPLETMIVSDFRIFHVNPFRSLCNVSVSAKEAD